MTQIAREEPNVARELRRVPELEAATEETLAAIAERSTTRSIRSRLPIIEQGVKAPGALILVRGALKSVRRTEFDERSAQARKRHHGDFVLLDVLRAPSLYVDASLLDDGVAPASLVALRSSTVLVIDWHDLQRIAMADGNLSGRFLAHFAARERGLVRRVDELALGPVDERVLHLLDGLARDFGTPVGGGRFIALPLRRQDLAAMVNATTETVSRLLARLEREGKARTTRDGIWWSGTAAGGQKMQSSNPPASSTNLGGTTEGGARVAS